MNRYFGTRRSPIGVDISRRAVNAVQLQRSRGKWMLDVVARYERQGGQPALDVGEVGVFAQILERRGFHGSEIVLAVPNETLKSDLLELPAVGPDVPIHQLARMELARTHKCRPDTFELASWPLPAALRGGESQQVMATACMHQDSERLLDLWQAGGLEVVALDVRAAATARVCRPHLLGHANISAALELSWDASNLVIMYRDAVIYDRTLSGSGLACLHETLMKRLAIESDIADFAINEVGFTEQLKDEWARWPLLKDARGIMAAHFTSMLDELNVSFTYAQHRYPDVPVDRVILLGQGASIPNLQEPIGAMLGMETQILSPGDGFECPPELLNHADDPDLTVAVGLAARELEL